MASTGLQETLIVPKHLLAGKTKFGMDIGGSLIKVARCVEEGDDVRVTFTSYVRENMTEALQEIRDSVSFEEGELITTTGIGSYQFKDLIQDTLGVRTTNQVETDCLVDGLKFLIDNGPLEDFVYPPSVKGKEMFAEFMQSLLALKSNIDEINSNTQLDFKPLDDEATKVSTETKYSLDDVFPCLVCMIGSGGLYMKVEKNGMIVPIDMCAVGGLTILGLGSLLTGAKSFDELVALAEGGDAGRVEVQQKDLQQQESVDTETDSNDVYRVVSNRLPAFSFGHSVNKEISDFRREDLAAAVIANVSQTIATGCHLANMASDVNMVLFCGSVCGQSNYIRDEISKAFEYRSKANCFNIRRPYHFLKYGGYLGALGSMLRNCGQ